MRLIRVAAAVSIVLVSASAFAQDWIEYVDRAERFGVSLPGQPAIRETTYTSWRGTALPARVYTEQNGPRRYSITVVNYATDKDVTDVVGSIAYAAWNVRKKGGEITYDAYAQVDRIAGHELHVTNPDRSQTFVMIHLYARRLYILEATGPRGLAPPVDFLQSLSILDEDGKRIRFELDACGNRTTRVP
jgi:hypothetical protein